MHPCRLLVIVSVSLFLIACGEDSMTLESSKASQASGQDTKTQTASAEKAGSGTAGVKPTVTILPPEPTSTDCLRVIVQGNPANNQVAWSVNGEVVTSGISTRICSEYYKRDDVVTVTVGPAEQEAYASVTITNSPPKVVDISSTPEEIFAGSDVSVNAAAEDADGDDVSFTYQWLVNGEADPTLTEATLPGGAFSKGDTIQVLIVPNDFYVDGPTYESYAMTIPNAPPRITSQPPQGVTSLNYSYQVIAEDPDDNVFTYRLDVAPEGMSINEETGLINWSLMEAKPGDHTIAIIVADPEGAEAAQEYTLTLSPGS